MIKKILCLLAVLIICLGAFGGCDDKYNAVMYSNAKAWMNEEFLQSNLTYGSYYYNEENEIEYINDESYPQYRTFIIMAQEDFDSKFIEFPNGIDFEKEMLIIYLFTTVYPNRDCIIKKINLDERILIIEFKLKSPGMGVKDAAMPTHKCLVVKMDKLDVDKVEFIEV